MAKQKTETKYEEAIIAPEEGSVRERERAENKARLNWIQNESNSLANIDYTPQALGGDWGDLGNSMFDEYNITNPHEGQGELNEIRNNNQGLGWRIGSALGNMGVTAATTFLDNTVGFLWGIGSAVVNGDASKLWDNGFSNAMADINDWANENMPYYQSKYDQGLGTFARDFILNDLVRNSGFQIGTGLSMIVPGAILKVPGSALKLTKMASNFMKSGRAIRTGSAMKDLALSTWMSFGEASIEALNNKRDFVKYQTQLMNDEFTQKTAALDEQWKQLVMQKYGGDEETARASMDFNEYYNQKQELAAQKAQKVKFIEHEATKVGDITALANMAVLTPTNFMTFGKAFTGYNLNKRFGQIATDIVDAEGNVLKKNAFERTAKEVARTGKIEVKNPNYGKWGYNKEGKWVKDTKKYIEKEAKVQMRGKEKSALWEVGKNMFWEGNEEMMQEVGAQYSTALAETDMLNYEALAESGIAYDDILKQINSSWINFGEMANAFGKVYTDPAQYRQFFGGALGMLISPHFTRKPGGGVQFHLNNIGGEMAAVREQNSTNALIAEDINKMLNSDESKNYLKGMLRHAALEHVKQDAVTADSKIDYENADFAQFVSDITTMSNAGKLPLLQAHLDGLRNMDDEELKETCMNMCREDVEEYTDENGKKKKRKVKIGDFVDKDGNYIGNTEEKRQAIRKKLNRRIDRMQKDIDLYQSTMNDIDGATGGALDHETLAAFTWEKAQVMNKYSRAKEIIGSKDSISNIGVYQKYISDSALRLTNEKTSAEQELKQEKERLSNLPKIDGKPVEASVQQKNLEAKIKDLTTQINRATEISELLRKMSAFEVRNGNYEDDKKAIIELFDEYRDIAKVMPEIAKLVGVTDDNGKKLKTKNGKDREFPLEYILYTNQFDAFMQKIAGAKVDGIKDVSKDYEDAARLYARARQTEASIDNLIDDPTQYTAHRAELQQRILEHENKKTISKIQKEIEKGLDEGRITLDNLEEESKKITDSINTINSERGAARQLFDRAVAALSNTPYDELRQIAIRNIMQSKKYKNLGDMRDLINYVYMTIAANPKLSDAEKQVAMETFNKFVKKKKSIDDVHKSKVTPDNVNVESLYVLDTPENQVAKRALIGKDPKISLDNYKYTEQSYNSAQIAKNEIPQIINDAVERIYKAKRQPELADQLTTLGIDENKVAAGTESAKIRAEIDNKAKSIEQGINKLLETFKVGEILNNEEKNELFNKVQDLIDKTFNSDDYADEYKAEIDNLNLRWKAQSLDMIQSNLESRVAKRYNDTEIEGRIEVEKAFDEINKEVSKIQRSLEQSKGSAAFNDIFDRIAKEDYSIEPKNSFEIYYNSNGTIYRGHAVPCESLLNGRKCYAVAQQLDVDSFQYDIIDENGAIIGTLFSNELVEPSKRGESIKLDFTKLTSFDVNAPNLQSFREITTLKVPNITSEKTKRDVTERCKACRESFQEDEILDENGETKLQSNILSAIAKANMIMNAELTESKAEIEDVVETPTEIKKEHTGIKYFLLQDENSDMVRVMFPSNGNRVTFKDENGKTTTKKYSKALFKKEGYKGVIREIYGNDVEIVESSQEEWNPKANVETKQQVQYEHETESVVTTTTPSETNNKPIEQQPSTTETPTQPTVVEQKKQQRKKAEAKRKRAISQLDEQIDELDSMLQRLQDAAKQNPQYHDTVRTVTTFKQYVEFVRNNYKALGEPKNVVLDENQVFSMMDSFRQQLGKIFGNDVQFLSDEKIEQAAKDANNDIRFSKSDGEIYGFTNEGKIVLNKDKFRLDTPVHEYTHLWDKALIALAENENVPESVREKAKALWQRGVELMKEANNGEIWNDVANSDNYGKEWKKQGKSDAEIENLIASEVHSRLSGMLAAGKAIEFAGNKRIKKGFWAKLIEWFRQFKDFTLHHVFGMSKEDAQKVTLEQFLSAPVADFMLGTDPRDVSNINYTIASKPKKQAKPVDTNLKIGDTVQYSGVAKKAVVKSITSKGITIQAENGNTYKGVPPKYLNYLYGTKPSENAKFSDIEKEDAVSAEEYIARFLVGSKIKDTKNDITDINEKIKSKDGKAINDIVKNQILPNIPFTISEKDATDILIDIANKDDIKQYAIEAHYAAQDKEWEAQVSAINERIDQEPNTLSYGQTEGQSDDEDWDMSLLDSPYEDEAIRNAIDGMIADELSEEAYQEYLEQRANEEGVLTDEQWFEIFGEEPQPDNVVGQIKTKTEELKDKVDGEVQPTPFNIINDDSGLDTLKNLAKKAKSEEAQPLDTFKPAISEWWIDDKSIPAIVGLRKKYPKANFEYIYQLYKSTGAYDYVKEGKLRKDQEVYIGYGQVGKLGNGTPLYNVVFFVKDDNGNYQLIGTLSDTANQDPKTAKELHEQVEKLYNEQDTNGFFTDITITNTKPYVSETSVRGQNVVVASGEKTFHFSILAPNGNPITTTVSKVLNGSLMWSETQHSLKDTTLHDGKTIAKAISENENGKHVRIGYFDASTQLHDNMTADQQQIGLLEGFRNVGSKTKGHIVLILNKPDGRYQLVPMHVALFGDLMDNPYNPIVNDVNNILKKAWQIYSDNSMSIDDKDFELTKSGGIIQQLNEKLHFSGGQLHLFFEGKNGGISLSANGKAKVKNADGTLPRPKSEVEFLQLFNYQLADCMININEKNISDPKVLNKLIMSDVFSTNLSGTDFRNAFFTVKPIDAKGKIKEVYRDMPEQYILKNNQLKKIYGEKVASIGDTDVYMCEDLDGDISLYGVKQGTDEYNSDLLKNITTPNQRARMLAYAKIKAGMNQKGEFERKDIPADYIQEIYGKEYLVHQTIYGDEEYYDTETFVKQNPYAVVEETQEGGQQAPKPVTTYKPQEHKPFVSEKLIKDAFTSSKFAKAFIELERLINNPNSKENLLKSTIDNISKEQLEDYIQGQKQRLSTSTKRTLLSLESRFGIDTLKMFAAVKDIYDSNVYSDLYDLLDSVTDTDGNIDYSALTQEQIDKVFDRNKIITDDNMFDKNTECEAF